MDRGDTLTCATRGAWPLLRPHLGRRRQDGTHSRKTSGYVASTAISSCMSSSTPAGCALEVVGAVITGMATWERPSSADAPPPAVVHLSPSWDLGLGGRPEGMETGRRRPPPPHSCSHADAATLLFPPDSPPPPDRRACMLSLAAGRWKQGDGSDVGRFACGSRLHLLVVFLLGRVKGIC